MFTYYFPDTCPGYVGEFGQNMSFKVLLRSFNVNGGNIKVEDVGFRSAL